MGFTLEGSRDPRKSRRPDRIPAPYFPSHLIPALYSRERAVGLRHCAGAKSFGIPPSDEKPVPEHVQVPCGSYTLPYTE